MLIFENPAFCISWSKSHPKSVYTREPSAETGLPWYDGGKICSTCPSTIFARMIDLSLLLWNGIVASITPPTLSTRAHSEKASSGFGTCSNTSLLTIKSKLTAGELNLAISSAGHFLLLALSKTGLFFSCPIYKIVKFQCCLAVQSTNELSSLIFGTKIFAAHY